MSDDPQLLHLPEDRRFPWDREALESGDPKQLKEYMKKLIRELQDVWTQIAQVVNRKPEYFEQDAKPTVSQVAEDDLAVWKDTDAGSGQPIMYLVYNKAGTVYSFASEETVP